MKKARIMITALTVLAVVGGALAFKAKNYQGDLFCTTGTQAGPCITTITFTFDEEGIDRYCLPKAEYDPVTNSICNVLTTVVTDN